MAARRADTPPPVLRLVRDGEGVAAPVPTDTHPQLAFPFLALVPAGERQPRTRRASCAASPARRRPRQLDLIERHHHLQVLGSRPRSIGRKRLTRKERKEFAETHRYLQRQGVYAKRPRTWGECQDRPAGPCGFVTCRHNMFLEVDEKTGVIKYNFPGKQVWELEETCSLRAAGDGEHTLERTGELLNLTLERARQVQDVALEKLRGAAEQLRGDDDGD